ncbi:enolase-phosphatase E1 [Geosmithia morbida]|uniref:Enolase-phosphatase E1 n=1 Tax=Geosmithia morbida TaxID=1094350 RepID=A0A9P4YQP1_9HYPO|nr:enolase-phosphatase E1 [Geosmithia morbida]KAF4120280.1 enolase-phosphatase E1 [Geosmithia morbida]
MVAGFAEFDVLLLDIEGTVCPISFVKDVLFPYALDSLPKVLDEQWDDVEFKPYRDAFPEEYRDSRDALEAHVRDLVAGDVKIAYLKGLQGYLWEHGYQSGEIKAPLFPDVAPFIAQTHAAGKRVVIYSSGSVPAQKLLFGHIDADPSDLTPLISDWFDTVNAGPKTKPASYKTILSKYPDTRPEQWLFLSDNMAEVDAALTAGMRSLPVSRPGNTPLPDQHPLSALALTTFEANEGP